MNPISRLLAPLALLLACTPVHAETVTVFAAASLKESLDAVARSFEAATGHQVNISYAGSNVLAKQIENGAPAQVFISADGDWMEYVEGRNFVVTGTRRDILGNELVLIAPAASTLQLKLEPKVNIAAALGDKRIAIANPDAVPAGKYAKAAFTSLGAWGGVEQRIAAADNVRAALALVARGEVALGVVYRTDALAERKVRIVDTFPQSSYTPIVYPMARIRGHGSPAATAFSGFVATPESLAIFERFGFRAP